MAKRTHSIQLVKGFLYIETKTYYAITATVRVIFYSLILFLTIFSSCDCLQAHYDDSLAVLEFSFSNEATKFLQLVLQFSDFYIFDRATNDQFIIVFCLLLNTIELSTPLLSMISFC